MNAIEERERPCTSAQDGTPPGRAELAVPAERGEPGPGERRESR